jgi:HD-GYP domain-containing protein (c-di-GMP phosphodiesterase class II)
MDAIDRLQEARGKHFDPIVVEAMIEVIGHE